jgi:hypothetical protein
MYWVRTFSPAREAKNALAEEISILHYDITFDRVCSLCQAEEQRICSCCRPSSGRLRTCGHHLGQYKALATAFCNSKGEFSGPSNSNDPDNIPTQEKAEQMSLTMGTLGAIMMCATVGLLLLLLVVV